MRFPCTVKALQKGATYIMLFISLLVITNCRHRQNGKQNPLEFALENAGPNRKELEIVLEHYSNEPEKLEAAKYLIVNMPGHNSFRSDLINEYYDIALSLFKSELSPIAQRDSLLSLSEGKFHGLEEHTIQDIRIISSDYLISNIDRSFEVWKNERWAQHLTFDEFCEYILPYKCTELQSFDAWRDTLSLKFSEDLDAMLYDDESYDSPFRAVNVVRGELLRKIKPVGMYNKSGYPMRSASTISNMTFGTCEEYVNLGVLTFRSLGIPVIIDYTPSWGRYRAGHSWYVLLNEHGEYMPSEWDISSCPGSPFFPYQRIPKVYRKTYAINRERVPYHNKSTYKYPFSLFEKDVTDFYFRTTDVNLPIVNNVRLDEEFAYIATFSGFSNEWTVIDYCDTKDRNVTFKSMGRNILYCVFGYDGNALRPLNSPFIIHKDGRIEMVHYNPEKKGSIDIRRKYYTSENVTSMRSRILGAKIQASNNSDFRNCIDALIIDSLSIPDLMPIRLHGKYRYWRYLSPNGSYGSISELAFFDSDSIKIEGCPIGKKEINEDINMKAFDEDWLSNFETEMPDGNWVGMDFGQSISVDYIRVVPRGDENDIHPGDEYELKYWDGFYWVTHEIKKAVGNSLHFDNAPIGALLWLHNRTRGRDERVFRMVNGKQEWW